MMRFVKCWILGMNWNRALRLQIQISIIGLLVTGRINCFRVKVDKLGLERQNKKNSLIMNSLNRYQSWTAT